ncbi:hypothetical protein SCHPADRAFT_16277 [Schizopora paradoxa]|uniref:Uncharacterized protein n=1 Tax=Schizopora paradoxa TaxID=27342 RepID=A0A0H2S8V1_9AGAM|nr:hypothetical protein SCHPADRAFT_16277 [Schizopora paradoxa]
MAIFSAKTGTSPDETTGVDNPVLNGSVHEPVSSFLPTQNSDFVARVARPKFQLRLERSKIEKKSERIFQRFKE